MKKILMKKIKKNTNITNKNVFIFCFSLYNKGKQIYEKHKEKLHKEVRKKYQNLFEEGKVCIIVNV